MNLLSKTYGIVLSLSLLLLGCGPEKGTKLPGNYSSETLEILRVSEGVYLHRSFLDTEDFGRVACNGAVFFNGTEAVIFDTPADTEVSGELIRWAEDSLKCRVKAVIPTHFHADCLGGLSAFHDRGIPSYSSHATIALAKSNGSAVPQYGFELLKAFKTGSREIVVEYMGEGHTRDNIVGYFPGDEVMFGGCLVKAEGAGKGYLGDANTAAWPETVEKLKARHPGVKTVIPGHGDPGGIELLDYTIHLFRQKE